MLELDGQVRTIAVDTMNYGESFRTEREPTIRYIAEVLLEAITHLGIEQFHTFGHHTGVSIQAEMAVIAPGRVLSLIMNGPTFALPEEREYNMRTLSVPNPISVKGTQIMWAWSRTKDNYPLPYGVDAPHAAEIMHRDTVDTLRAGENWHWGYRAVFSHDLIATMQAVECPMFLVSGAEDPAHFFHERAAAAHPNARTYVSETGGVYYAESHASDLAPQIHAFISKFGADPV